VPNVCPARVSEDKGGPTGSDSVKKWESSVGGEEAAAGGGKMSVLGGSGGGGSGSMSLYRFGNLRQSRRVRRSDSGKASSWNGGEPMDFKPWVGSVVPCQWS